MRVVPPMVRRWFEVLPSPYNIEKPVVALLLPMDWDCQGADLKRDKRSIMVATSKNEEKALGLQVFDPNLMKYEEHLEVFDRCGVKTPTAAYIGAVSLLPQRLLMDEDVTVLLFSRDEFWRRPIDLKRCWKGKPQELRC